MAKPNARLVRAENALHEFGLTYPEATEDHPWGHLAIKVRSKAFVFMAFDGQSLSVTAKLPESNTAALTLPFASPTGHGLGKSGWVTARFEGNVKVPVDLMKDWIDESYRTIAPKKLVATL
jgi:predicted DNA-binding protein (MmcQ/YjbR family)